MSKVGEYAASMSDTYKYSYGSTSVTEDRSSVMDLEISAKLQQSDPHIVLQGMRCLCNELRNLGYILTADKLEKTLMQREAKLNAKEY